MKINFSRKEIIKKVPQGEGIVWLDKIVELGDSKVVAERLVTNKDTEGHFGILPRHKMVEMIGVAASFLLRSHSGQEDKIATFSSGKYENPNAALVGDTVSIEVSIIKQEDRLVRGLIWLGNLLIYKEEFTYNRPVSEKVLHRVIKSSRKKSTMKG